MPTLLQGLIVFISAFVFLGIVMFISKKIAYFIDKKRGVTFSEDCLEGPEEKGDNNVKETD